jgi:cardiolipin synthase
VKYRQLPNIITMLRVALMPPLAYYLLIKNYPIALIIFMVAGASDALDGYLAKHFKWTSRFGAIADPLADKMLMLVSYSYLASEGYLPIWLLALVVGRDIFIVSAAYAFHKRFGPFDMQPSWLSKFNTTFQIFLVTLVMFSLVFTNIPSILKEVLIVIVAFTSLASGLQYGWMGIQATQQKLQQKQHQHEEDENNANE